MRPLSVVSDLEEIIWQACVDAVAAGLEADQIAVVIQKTVAEFQGRTDRNEPKIGADYDYTDWSIPHAFTEPDLEAHVRKAIEALPQSSVVGIIPLVMKSTNGKASPDAIRECFNRLTADTVIKQYDSDRGGAQEDDRTGQYRDCAAEVLTYAAANKLKTKVIFLNDGPGLLLGSMWNDYAYIEELYPNRVMVTTLRMIPERLTLDWLRA